ncbi:hypothetical protein BGZ60DRAFT_279565 [Tricladium varicosporioides]|nr:hypothetical protein BGZ60DRAFT_279565 [Hymenoscyphus varicosporioides]
MCDQLMTRTKMLCGDTIETIGIRVSCPTNCGIFTPKYNMGTTSKRDLCDDCIARGDWVKNAAGKWVKN